MTMFSMKPKFNLAEFLAEPAKPNSSRRRNRMNFAPQTEPAEEAKAEKAKAPAPKKPQAS